MSISQQLPADLRAEILRLLQTMTVPQVARRVGVVNSTVRNVGRRAGVKFIVGRAGKPKGSKTKRRSVEPQPPISTEPNYRAQARHQRWGSPLGARWL